MKTTTESTVSIEIPSLPSSVKNFVPYINGNPDGSIEELLQPFKAFESELRKLYAQHPAHEAVKDGNINLVPIFAGHEKEIKIKARSLQSESEEESSKFIMPLKDEDRKPNGAPAIVSSFKDFRQNFNLFSESSLSGLDWNNVVAAGSAVTTALLPVPKKWAGSKRRLREYYHEHLAPASDVDLFIYGLNEEQAIEKIKQIERNIKDSILHETTTIRTKNAITIASQYPTRHVQIVLRLYDSVSQIITGFDVDCACAAYTGDQVYAAPRAIAAFMTQCNTIDLTRRSPSYENRLSKYSHRGFEVHWPLLERSRVDPTIFERSFGRTQGLARLLILEKLPKTVDRETYMDQRRAERGRPALHRNFRHQHKMGGNIKDQEEDEVAEWVEEDDVGSYHTMTVPYGPKYHAAKINRLLYSKDLLLNAEWNQPKEREVYLHRHPCFFGTAEEVIQDCCGYCPVPKTDEENKIAEEEKKTNVSGKLKFLTDDPGRQEIGSFNPITDDEWTTMAYVGDTAHLCQAIVDGELEHVEDWCSQEGVDVNRRDYTGRTPLHLAVMASKPEIVQCLIDAGARLIARLVDGRTALHIAAARGNAEMVKALMDKSLANEEEEEEKEDARRAARKAELDSKDKTDREIEIEDDAESEASEITLDSEQEEEDAMTMGSFVKIDKEDQEKATDGVVEDSMEDPDVYDINVIAWDYGLSPLHLAILNGHLEIIELLVSEYGADVLVPVKLLQPGTSNARGAIMTLILVMSLPREKAIETAKLLIKLGATSAQADMNYFTVFHYVVAENNIDILDILIENDRPAALGVLNNIGTTGGLRNNTNTPLTTAIHKNYQDMVAKLLELGAKPSVPFEDWIKAHMASNHHQGYNISPEHNLYRYKSSVDQPIILAAVKEMGKSVEDLLSHGADPCTLEKTAQGIVQSGQIRHYNNQAAEAVLDIIRKKIKLLQEWEGDAKTTTKKPEALDEEDKYTREFEKDTYRFWSAASDYATMKATNKTEWENYEKSLEGQEEKGLGEKKAAVLDILRELKHAEQALVEAGAKTFDEQYPDITKPGENQGQQYVYKEPELKPYNTSFHFQVPDLNENKKEGFIKLFEAAWNNDLQQVKALTLAPWELKQKTSLEDPLQVAVQDSNGFSPFSIAVLRGHFDLARRIIDICKAQYQKDDGSGLRQLWNVMPDGSDDSSDDGETLPIVSELVNDKFTIDNLGEVSNVVKSHVLPSTMIGWYCLADRFDGSRHGRNTSQTLLNYAVSSDNMTLLKFIIEIGAEEQAVLAEHDEDQKFYTIPQDAFHSAIRLGRTSLLAEMIRCSGAGIPFNEIISKSGIELKSKPRYYQGLSVGGKKRADWAQAPGGNMQVNEDKRPPLLRAAHGGCLDSVEWFMSDAPMRRYKEFAEANKHDKRIRTLEESGKGFDKMIGKWLNANSELTLHCAILYNSNPFDQANIPHSLALIKHLISVSPESLEHKSSEGFTPLQLAVFARRPELVSYLLSAGANQLHRDNMGRNMVHAIVCHKQGRARTDAEEFESLLSLFDREKVKDMMLERCTAAPGALTPLAYWMAGNNSIRCRSKDLVEVLTSYGSGQELEMINGEGDLPLHVAIKQGLTRITAFLVSLNLRLLHRENATGRTPLEMARDMHLSSCVANPPSINTNFYYYPGQHGSYSIIQRQASSFVPQTPDQIAAKEEVEDSKKRIYEICLEVDRKLEEADGGMRKRRLVSLFEANEVAKRLAGNKTGGHNRYARFTVANGYNVGEQGKADVVSELMGDL